NGAQILDGVRSGTGKIRFDKAQVFLRFEQIERRAFERRSDNQFEKMRSEFFGGRHGKPAVQDDDAAEKTYGVCVHRLLQNLSLVFADSDAARIRVLEDGGDGLLKIRGEADRDVEVENVIEGKFFAVQLLPDEVAPGLGEVRGRLMRIFAVTERLRLDELKI